MCTRKRRPRTRRSESTFSRALGPRCGVCSCATRGIGPRAILDPSWGIKKNTGVPIVPPRVELARISRGPLRTATVGKVDEDGGHDTGNKDREGRPEPFRRAPGGAPCPGAPPSSGGRRGVEAMERLFDAWREGDRDTLREEGDGVGAWAR